MPSFDIVAEINLQEIDNAVNQTAKEIITRYDFKGTQSEIKFDRTLKKIVLTSDSESHLETLIDIFHTKALRRSVDIRGLKKGKAEHATGRMLRQEITFVEVIERDLAKKIVSLIKDSKLKLQPSIQGDTVRITGKNRDDLQTAISLVKNEKLEAPLVFKNFRD